MKVFPYHAPTQVGQQGEGYPMVNLLEHVGKEIQSQIAQPGHSSLEDAE